MKLGKKKLQELKNRKISIENLNEKYFYTKKDGINVENMLKLLDENICSFKEIVDKLKSIKNDWNNNLCLKYLLNNEKSFEELIENNRLNKEDSKYLLNKIDNEYELEYLCKNTPLIKFILNEFVLNKELVDRLNTIVKKWYKNHEWFKYENIHTLFDLIEYKNKDNDEILKLNELNKKTYTFDLSKFTLNDKQRLELIEVLRNNEIALNRMIQIVDNQLESNYDFESLMNYLKKLEKKSILNI